MSEHEHSHDGHTHDDSHQNAEDKPTHEQMLNSPAALECIEECLNCHGVALQTFNYCVSRGGVYANAQLVYQILDCIEITHLCADWLRRGSILHHHAAALCAQTCDECDNRCAGFHDDEDIGKCAKACQACAQACRRLSETPTQEITTSV